MIAPYHGVTSPGKFSLCHIICWETRCMFVHLFALSPTGRPQTSANQFLALFSKKKCQKDREKTPKNATPKESVELLKDFAHLHFFANFCALHILRGFVAYPPPPGHNPPPSALHTWPVGNCPQPWQCRGGGGMGDWLSPRTG